MSIVTQKNVALFKRNTRKSTSIQPNIMCALYYWVGWYSSWWRANASFQLSCSSIGIMHRLAAT